jgi:hypothetical protein
LVYNTILTTNPTSEKKAREKSSENGNKKKTEVAAGKEFI